MNHETWDKECDNVRQTMTEHVEPFLSPIWKFRTENDLKLHGSGSYIMSNSRKFIITNEHVAKYISSNNLTHSFHNSDSILRLTNPFSFRKDPVDVAISKIDDAVWDTEVNEGQAIPLDRFDLKHAPVENELLFFAGFSGKRARIVFGDMFSRGTAYLTQEFPLTDKVEEGNSNYHISIPYPPELVRSTDPTEPLPDPHGFSGSLLWNTKRVECKNKNIEWEPSMATVTGILWGWPSAATCILATKVEHLQIKELIEQYESE